MTPTPSRPPIAFFASDIEGSTRLWEGQPGAMSAALHRHDGLMRTVIETQGGRVFKTVGDGFFACFPVGGAAAQAAFMAQQALAAETWPTDRPIHVRMALHTGPAEERDGDFFGPSLNRLARLLAIGHGGQILLSESAAALARDELPAGSSLRDMGRHRLKDLDQAEAVSMLIHPDLEAEFPALKSLDNLPNNLPRQLTSFVGRERERRAVAELLKDEALVTLVGAGGTGKTRLALQVAAEALEEFPDGVWLIELAALTDPALVPQAVASVLGIREDAQPAQALLNALRDRSTLLILDNCERLLDACADLVAKALQAAPRLKILVTSREALNLPGEAIFRVPTLSVGAATTAADALAHDAVRLLVDRVRLVDSRFELTDRLAPVAAAICTRLDGIPLAIELAASRAKALSLEGIAGRLDDRFRLLTAGSRTVLPRQQTLRATIDWSHDMLDVTDRTLLRRAAVFAGGWTLEAAEAVCADDALESWEILDGLMRLVEKSLVIHDADAEEARYRLLESVRQYAAERLEPDEKGALRERHAEFYASLVVSSEEGIQGPDQASWLERLEREHGNIRAALGFFRERPDLCERALDLVGAIGRFWTVRGYLTEGRTWIEGLLACASPEPTLAKATAWRTAGQIAYWQGDSLAGRRFGEESLEICRRLGDQDGEIKSLFRLGFAALTEGDLPAARGYFEAALAMGRALGHSGLPHLLNAMGEVALAEESLDEAQSRFEEALTGFRAQKDQRSIASVLKNLASVAIEKEDHGAAFRDLAEGIAIRSDLGSLPGVATTLETFAVLAGAQNRPARATMLLAAAAALHETYGSRPEPIEASRIEAVRVASGLALGETAFNERWAEGAKATVDAIVAFATEDREPS